MGGHGSSAFTPTRGDVQPVPTVVHGARELEHGITSIETASTYRSDVYEEKLTDVKDKNAKVVQLARENGKAKIGHADGSGSLSAAVEPSYSRLGCRYARRSLATETHNGIVVDGLLASMARGSRSSKCSGMGISGVQNTEVRDSIIDAEESLANLTLRRKDGRSSAGINAAMHSNAEGSVLKPSASVRKGGVSMQQRLLCDQVFKRNKHEREFQWEASKDLDVVASSSIYDRDAPAAGSNNPALAVQLSSGYFWHRPFATSQREKVTYFRGLPYVETFNPGMQKSWHLEAISALTREQYASLKMTMLRLSKGNTNLDPKLLIMLSRGSWEVLQEGTFGTVYIGCVEGLGNCAVKIPVTDMVQQDPVGVMRRYINEWDILSRCDHPNIVKLRGGLIFGVFDIWLCTELIKGADLHSIKYGQHTRRTITAKASLKMCRELAEAIHYLHTPTSQRRKVVHRDIKPENIIVMPDWSIKLCDFGDACENTGEEADNISGATWLYAPPELLKHKSIMVDIVGFDGGHEGYVAQLSEKWDIWSMGCVFQEMFGYSGPFHHLVDAHDKPAQICEKMVVNAVRGLVPRIPPSLAATKIGRLIAQCLQNDAEARPTAAQICAVLRAPDASLLH
ncbi:serine/threonine protein kinase [Babesia caballi]|uniref:Serine/threonine protein kinase n=1 Tax=Babesia caballi TaxID=5871 RepID=A0AAV4M0D4_BABCB|nr:serine/threonine protein kinase [Babesia caballi]